MHHGFQVPAVVQFHFVSAFDLFLTRRDIRHDSMSQNKSSDISGISLIIKIMAMNQKVNMNVWHSKYAKKKSYKASKICENFWDSANHRLYVRFRSLKFIKNSSFYYL